MTDITTLPEWQALQNHQRLIAKQSIQDWFVEDHLRFKKFSLEFGDILFDFSKNNITDETVKLLISLAERLELNKKIEDLFKGTSLNFTEQRPALHTALRNQSNHPIFVKDKNVMNEIKAAQEQMQRFIQKIHDKTWRGATGKEIRDIVNIGIGGSHLGPLLTTHALNHYKKGELNFHFMAHMDLPHVHEILQALDPERTLFIISSKSFTTIETLTNAKTVRNWLKAKLRVDDLTPHFVAVTAAEKKAIEFGIPHSQIFPLWDWVGGRYSVWSPIGLPLVLMIGMDHFKSFLSGGYAVDEHFRHTPFSHNIPVLMALLGIWYINFYGAENYAVIPYSHHLNYLRAYLQQLDMESNGKRISSTGLEVSYGTGPIVFGEHGCNGQHAFHQLLHQSQKFIPIDFILVGQEQNDLQHHQDILIASALSQAQALLKGKTYQEAFNELIAAGYTENEAKHLAEHKVLPGNRPSSTLFLKKMTPYNLGALLALYEHKIFVQGAIWQINSFDQWGVELGKQLLPTILKDLTSPHISSLHDGSTQGLIEFYKQLRDTVC